MKALSKLQETLLAFVDQGEEHLLLLRCEDTDVPLVLKVIEAVDQASATDVFLKFGHPCGSEAIEYMDEVLSSLDLQIVGTNVIRQTAGLPLWDCLPKQKWIDVKNSLDVTFDHVQSFLPKGDHRVLWAFIPTTIEDETIWAQVVGAFNPKPGHRVVVRATDKIVEVFRSSPDLSALLTIVDLSPQAMADELVQSVQDPTTPPKQRNLELFQLAGMDFAHKRYVEAVKKFELVYKFFEDYPDSESIQAMCLIGVGDVARLIGDKELARQRYQQALALTKTKPDTLPVAMMACSLLGDLRGFDDVLEYYAMASEIAGKLCNLPFKCDVMEKMGVVMFNQGDVAAADIVWRQCLKLCLEGEYEDRAATVAERLAKL